MCVLVVEHPERYGWKNAGEVEEQCRGDDLLERLVTYDPVAEVAPVVGEPSLEVPPQTPAYTTTLGAALRIQRVK